MADYNDKDISTMRRDALRRMQEMQRRAAPPPTGSPPPEKPPASPSLISSLLGGGKLPGGLAIDEEKAMIAMLIYILYKQGADIKLLLALGYLLM